MKTIMTGSYFSFGVRLAESPETVERLSQYEERSLQKRIKLIRLKEVLSNKRRMANTLDICLTEGSNEEGA